MDENTKTREGKCADLLDTVIDEMHKKMKAGNWLPKDAEVALRLLSQLGVGLHAGSKNEAKAKSILAGDKEDGDSFPFPVTGTDG